MVYDLDVGRQLEYEWATDVRRVIRKLLDSGQMADSQVHASWRKPGASGGRPTTEYYLSERAAIKVAVKSNTPKAVTITDQVIEVFVQARNGQLPAQQQEQPVLPKYDATRVAEQHLELGQLFGLDPDMAKAAAARLTQEKTSFTAQICPTGFP